MNNYSKNDVIIVRYPFSDISNSKIRPAVIVSASHVSEDVFIVPLTSKTTFLLPGEFVLKDWVKAGLNVETAVKRGIYTVSGNLIIKRVGAISISDAERLEISLRDWLGF
uniref:mRNA interferase MazF n=1 Tax=Candidatus Kentrum sp. DK TaxID=2126562 RepID=A0A450RUT2_9GAMM|nr:MAG: mRNA interferase MazF [Candidatus Kentron sp. DK]